MPFPRPWAEALAVCGLLVALCWTLLTDASRLMADFQVDRWLIAHQADALRQGYLPSHFSHADMMVFYPVFAFYGGTLFVFAAAIALAVGSAAAAQVIVYVLVLAAAYGGWLWLGRIAGLRWWQAHVPAVVYVTSAYVITNIYVRQDLTETVATAMIPLLLASALSILRADRLHAGPAAALAASTIVLGGSHNLTLLWSVTVIGVVALVLAGAVPSVRALISRRALLRVLAVAVPAMAVNAWYLVPSLAYHTHTAIAHRIDEWRAMVIDPEPAVAVEHLFALGRPSPFPDSALSLTLPVLAIAWVLIAAVAVRREWRHAWGRTLVILVLAATVLLVLITYPKVLSPLPDPWLMIQFGFRLETFILFGLCGAIIAALVLLNHSGHRWLPMLLIPIAVLGVVDALGQIRAAPRAHQPIPLLFDNFVFFGLGDFGDAEVQELSPPDGTSPTMLARAHLDGDGIDTRIRARPGDVLYTNVMVPAEMIDIQGAHVVGRWLAPPWSADWQRGSYLVVQVDDDATPDKARIVIRQAQTAPVIGGRILSLLGVLGLGANAVVILRARRREPAAARTAGAPA